MGLRPLGCHWLWFSSGGVGSSCEGRALGPAPPLDDKCVLGKSFGTSGPLRVLWVLEDEFPQVF